MSGRIYMVFDIESVGLHGEAFAYGYVVVDEYGSVVASDYQCCHPDQVAGAAEDREWIEKNILPFLPKSADDQLLVTADTPARLRSLFFKTWLDWRDQGATLWADCGWPVEARFLAQCVDDHPKNKWLGPYPLHEIATARMLAGFDPLATCDRLNDELPAHHPLADAKQSARLLLEALTY